jgi:hypothetical protein
MAKWEITMRLAGQVYSEVSAESAQEVAALATKVAESIWKSDGDDDWRGQEVLPCKDCEKEVAR